MVEMTGMRKRYGGVRALQDASLTVGKGEIHGLLGPNGSGKSTLGKVLAGSVRPDAGTIVFDGEPVTITGPKFAHRLGVAAVYQQLSGLPELTVLDNLMLGTEPTRWGFVSQRALRRQTHEVLERLAPALGAVRPTDRYGTLTPGQQQLIEIGKALLRVRTVLILDEATASLHRDQVEVVFDIARELRDRGTSIIIVTHRLGEIMELCDRATILRSGQTVDDVDVATTTPDDLVRRMVGDVEELTRDERPAVDGPITLSVSGLASTGLGGTPLRGVDVTARKGEVIGLGGLQGQGQSELLLALFGAIPQTGTIRLGDDELVLSSPRAAVRQGVALVPGDRGTQGLMARRSIAQNLTVASLSERTPGGVVVPARERRAAASMVDALSIKIGDLSDPVSSLSGGNAQKVVFGKWLLTKPRLVLLDDPSKGVDIGAKAEIARIVRQLADSGVTVIVNSSEDRELAALSDRVLVMYEGSVHRELVGDEITEQALVAAALRIGEGDQGEPEEAVA